MAETVVERLELIDIEEHQRKRPVMPRRPRDLAVEKIEEMALVRHLRQTVGDRQLIDLLVVQRLDVAPFDELQNRAAAAHQIAVAERRDAGQLRIVDEAAVRTAEVLDEVRTVAEKETGVLARDRMQRNGDAVALVPSDGRLLAGQLDAAPEIAAVDDDHARRSLINLRCRRERMAGGRFIVHGRNVTPLW